MNFMSVPNRDLPSVQKGRESRQFNIGIVSSLRREKPESTSRVTPKPPVGVGLNPLKDFDLTEGQTFGIPSARLGFPSARFGFPSDWLGFPSAQLGIPSVRLGTASFRPSGAALTSDRLWSRQEEAGLGVTEWLTPHSKASFRTRNL